MLLIPPVDKKCGNRDFVILFTFSVRCGPHVPGKKKKASRRAAHAVMKPSWVAVCTYWKEATDQRADVN